MKVVIEIKGGFGNQIFQFAFAKYLSDLGCNVKVNFQNITKFNLNYEYFGFELSSKFMVYILNLIYKFNESKKFNFIFKIFFKNSFQKFAKPEHFSVDKMKYFNHFDGYWQDVSVLENYKNYVKESLEKYESFEKSKSNYEINGLTLLHVRRGDYIDLNENLTLSFYEEAIDYCKKNIKNFKYDVFTDDKNWVVNQKLFNEALNIYGPSKDLDSLLYEVSKMMKYEHYIIGNSSFSLIPAVTSEVPGSINIVADPWFRNAFRNLNFKENWIKVKNLN